MTNMFVLFNSGHSFFENLVYSIVPEIIGIIELMGVIIIIIGSIKAFYMYGRSLLNHLHYPIKLTLGNSLALGLEFKMGSEILKTLMIQEINEIMILGAIIILRALLSVLIHYEVKSEKEHNKNIADVEF